MRLLQHPLLVLGAVLSWLTAAPVFCQTFQKTIGGAHVEYLFDVQYTRDDNYILTGRSSSNDSVPADLFVIKLNGFGDTLWTRVFGGDLLDIGYSVVPLVDLGSVLVGSTRSFGAGSSDGLFLLLDEDGGLVSSRSYGGLYIDGLYAALVDHDGGFTLLGSLGSSVNTERELLLIKTDQVGNVLWSKTYGGPLTMGASSLIRLVDNDLLIGGSAGVTAGALLMRVTPSGEIVWSKEYAHGQLASVSGMVECADGSVLVTGMVRSPGDSMFLMKVDPNGNVIWARKYHQLSDTFGHQLMELPGGDIAIIGSTWVYERQLDILFTRTDSVGGLVWSKAYGGALRDQGRSIDTTSTGGFLLWGHTQNFGAGGYDNYMVRTDSSGHSGCNEVDILLQVSEVPFSISDPGIAALEVELTVTEPAIQSAQGFTMDTLCDTEMVGLNEPPGMGTFHMYPNPVTAVLSIEMPENSGRYALQVHNSSGQLVFNGQFSDQLSSIDLKGQPQGLYMVTITTGSWRSTQRLVVDR